MTKHTFIPEDVFLIILIKKFIKPTYFKTGAYHKQYYSSDGINTVNRE